MNRKLKSALSVLLVITMALSLGISAFAEETEGQEQPAVCTGSAEVTDCTAETHTEGCPKYVSDETPAEGAGQGAEQGQKQPAVCTGSAEVTDCAADTHVEGCPKYVSVETPAEGAGQGAEQGQKQPAVCTGSAEVTDCAADTHVEGCPKYVSVETPAEGAGQGAEQGQKQPAVCAGSADAPDCAAETHIEGCPKYESADAAGEGERGEPNAQKAAVQARIDALPEKDDFAAMSEEDKNGVAAEYAAIMEALYKLCEAEGIEDIDELEGIDLEKLLALSDAINEYAAAPVADVFVAWIGAVGYKTLEAAVRAAASGDTITLGECNYTLYGINSVGTTKGKDLTFVGQGADKTAWNIGAEGLDPAHYGTEYNGDYSFDGAGAVTFRNMTLRSGNANYLGFIRADKTRVENCVVNGKTFYWGYSEAIFSNTTFNCPSGDYALWTYSSPVMSFDSCTFNSSGKVINVYTDFGAGKNDITVNFNNCTVKSSAADKSALNINDSNMGGFKYIVNITTTPGAVSGLDPSSITCSRLFGFSKAANNTGRSVVSINGITVWTVGNRVSHAMDCGGVKYTDGHNDNAFDFTYSDWVETDTERTRTVKKQCKYCGYDEEYEEKENKLVLSYDANGGTGSMTPDSRFGEGTVTVRANGFEREGYDFTGWNTAADGKGKAYKPGDELELTESLTLYAQWNKIVTYTVTYTDGVDNVILFPDQVYSGLKSGDRTPGFVGVPERRGYRFVGWEPRVSQTVTGDAVYKAVWERIVVWSYDPGKGPRTGDESNLALWTVLMLGAGAAAAGAGLYVRKRRRSK